MILYQSYANLNGLPSPGRHFERATKAIIYLPTRDNYTEIHEKFLNDIGTGSEHHISYSSFVRIWKSYLPEIQFLSPQTDL
ncbi:7698_t:CDS:2, partial [Entrophospora sp. SA101]